MPSGLSRVALPEAGRRLNPSSTVKPRQVCISRHFLAQNRPKVNHLVDELTVQRNRSRLAVPSTGECLMGRGPSYTVENYADRILLYLYSKKEGKTTQEIMKEVKGTDYRIIEGLFFLYDKEDVSAQATKYGITWSLNLVETS